jgi:pyridoxal 5'-phosphate synthase pdxS subunit
VPNFSAGGMATPADAALMMWLGAEAVFVGSGVFKSSDPERRARAIVDAVTYYREPEVLADISKGWARRCLRLDVRKLADEELMAVRGW